MTRHLTDEDDKALRAIGDHVDDALVRHFSTRPTADLVLGLTGFISALQATLHHIEDNYDLEATAGMECVTMTKEWAVNMRIKGVEEGFIDPESDDLIAPRR